MNNPTNIKLILFDIGNVLVKYNSTRLCMNLDKYSYLSNHDPELIYEYLFKFGVFTRFELGQICVDQLYIDLKNRFNLHCDMYDFITVWTEELHTDKKMRLITNTLSKTLCVGLLSNIDSVRYRYIIQSDMIGSIDPTNTYLSYIMGMVKPDIRIANYIGIRSDYSKSQILFIDNKEINVRSMQAGGICSIQYSNPTKLENDLREMGIEL